MPDFTSTTENLTLPYIMPAQAQKHVTHNEALRTLDCLVQLSVRSRTLAAPPAEPAAGERFIVPEGAEGAFAGHEGEIAAFQDGAFAFLAPREGWIAFVADEGSLVVRSAQAWEHPVPDLTGADLQNLGSLGIGTEADATNRLALSAAASLFSHAGEGHRLKINKGAPDDDATILFQTDFATHAEIGTAGDDDFRLKVSADGTIFRDAITVNRQTGDLALAGALTLPLDVFARRFQAVSADFPFLVTSIANNHPTPHSSVFEFSFGGGRRYAFGTNHADGNFNVTAYAADGSWMGSPLVMEYAGTQSMDRAIHVKANSDVGIGKVPTAKLDVDGALKLRSFTRAQLPAAAAAGAGTLAFVADAPGGAQLAYSDGASWRKVRDGAAF